MDLGSQGSVLESVDDNQGIQDTIHHSDDEIQPNRLHGNSYKEDNNNGTSANQCDKNIGIIPNISVNSSPPPLAAQSPAKGYGLKKWRRIKRSSPNQIAAAEAEDDGGKVLKRGLSFASIPPAKPLHFSSLDSNQNAVELGHSESSSSLDSRFAVGTPSPCYTDSENSRSSTAASAPKMMMHASPVVSGYGQTNNSNRMKNLVAKNVGTSNQRVQPGKSTADNNKKQRGERIKIDKQNSQSSMESDSRSSKSVFTLGVSSATSNGRSVNFCGENGNEACPSEELFGDEAQTAFRKEDGAETDGLLQDDLTADSSWKDKNGKGDGIARDLLVESLRSLQSVQEALEKEVRNLGEVGKEPVSLHANSVIQNGVPVDSTFAEICEPSPSNWLPSEKDGETASTTLGAQVRTLTQKVEFLESRLEEAKGVLELKDSRITKLEATINGGKSTKEESESSAELLQEMELEFEGLFQQKLEAEIEYLALVKATEKLRVVAIDQRKLFEEQKSIMSNQGQVMNQLGEAEHKAQVVKKQVEKIEKYCGDIISTEEILKMQRRVCKLSVCFFVQLILVVLVFWVIVLELLYPQSGVIVPT